MMKFIVPLKFIAGGVFAGLIGFYMVVGALYAHITDAAFEYSIPFAFIIQGAALSMGIALLWGLCFEDAVIKNWRFFKRALLFNILLVGLVAVCFLTAFALPSDGATLWLAGAGVLALGFSVMAALYELYCRKTGQRYNELLRIFQQK